jgi:hypothetical protein
MHPRMPTREQAVVTRSFISTTQGRPA